MAELFLLDACDKISSAALDRSMLEINRNIFEGLFCCLDSWALLLLLLSMAPAVPDKLNLTTRDVLHVWTEVCF